MRVIRLCWWHRLRKQDPFWAGTRNGQISKMSFKAHGTGINHARKATEKLGGEHFMSQTQPGAEATERTPEQQEALHAIERLVAFALKKN